PDKQLVRRLSAETCETNEAAKRRPLVMGASKLPRHPFAAAPVAAALVLTEREPFAPTPMPIVLMNDDTRFVWEVIRFMHVPAGVALAYDSRGCAEGGHDDHACADCDN